jgi:hypothetical protein
MRNRSQSANEASKPGLTVRRATLIGPKANASGKSSLIQFLETKKLFIVIKLVEKLVLVKNKNYSFVSE